MLVVATAFKMIAEIGLFALWGQWLLGFLSGAGRSGNPFYLLLALLGRPWIYLARCVSPQWVLERHLSLVACFLLLLVWSAASIAKVSICLQVGMTACR